MAGSLTGQSRRRKRRRSSTRFSEINVTPFVDVMLVLLIVFMVSAPLLASGVSIDLPDSEAAAISEQNDQPMEVSLNEEGVIFLGEREVERTRLIPLLKAIMDQREDQRIYIRADENLAYAKVMDVLGAINRAGFNKVALISDPVSN